jgi:hypothetical protein
MEVLQFLRTWPNKHVPHEKRMIGTSADDPYSDSVSLIPTGETIDDIDAVPRVQVIDSTFAVDFPDLVTCVSATCFASGFCRCCIGDTRAKLPS